MKDFLFEQDIVSMLKHEPFSTYVDIEDEENHDFELHTKWRVKNNHFEYCEFDKRKMTAE